MAIHLDGRQRAYHPCMQFTYLRLDKNEINEDHNEIVLDVFVREPLAARTLRQTHTFTQGTVISATICTV